MAKRFLDALPALLFAVSGVVVCFIIEGIHDQLQSDVTYVSFCNVNSQINCDVVLTSPYAYLGGATVSLLGLLFYFVAAGAIVAAVVPDRARQRETAAQVVFGMSILGLLFSVYMAVVSFFVLQTVCLMCSALYLASIGLFASALRLRSRSAGPAARSKAALQERARRDRRMLLGGIGGGVCLVVIGVISVFAGAEGPGPQLTAQEIQAQKPELYRWYQERPRVDVPSDGHALGDPDASVVLVGFSDFECPHCARLDETLRELVRAQLPGLKVVFRHFPLSSECNASAKVNFHKDACSAAMASECAAEQDRFWPYQHALFAHQGALGRPQLLEYARTAGLDLAAFDSCLGSERARERVRQDTELGARLGVQSTPTIFLNGRRIEGAPKGEVLLDAITLARHESTSRAR
jgi:protein-disulfide isomerase/uncharacterized membrane protein